MLRNSSLGRAAAALAMVLGLGVASANAASITFDFTTAASNNGSYGNVRSYTDGTLTMYASAWYTTGNLTTSTFGQAALGTYNGWGLGVCNPSETNGPGYNDSDFPCESPNHAVDNNGQYDFVLFLFSQSVDLDKIYLNDLDEDEDVSFWVGNVSNSLDLTGKTVASLTSTLGFSSRTDVNNVDDYDLNKNGYNALLFGANFSGSDRDDYFKIKKLKAEYTPEDRLTPTPVPEPGTIALLGMGLVGVATALRRRRQAN